jgi:hypothetical protein
MLRFYLGDYLVVKSHFNVYPCSLQMCIFIHLIILLFGFKFKASGTHSWHGIAMLEMWLSYFLDFETYCHFETCTS